MQLLSGYIACDILRVVMKRWNEIEIKIVTLYNFPYLDLLKLKIKINIIIYIYVVITHNKWCMILGTEFVFLSLTLWILGGSYRFY